MMINFPIRFDENCRLGFLEMVLQDIKISKFSRGACPLPPPPVKSRFTKVLRLDSLLIRRDLPT